MRETNKVLLKLSKRAEKNKQEHLIDSFVDVGSLFTLLSNSDNQILFGRRGTGKTHVLSYLANDISKSGLFAIQLDMRTIGSTGGIYSDNEIPLSERATRLLVDVLCEIHEQILTRVLENSEELNLAVLGPLLDNLIESSTQVIVDGVKKTNNKKSSNQGISEKNSALFSLKNNTFETTFGMSDEKNSLQSSEQQITQEGHEKLRVHFSSVGNNLGKVLQVLPGNELWIMLDEWSEIPLDLQPYLADLLRRVVLPVKGISVKIAAIEQRCRLRISDGNSGHIGIEVGADAATSIDLDEFLVFDNNTDQAKMFFQELIFRHVLSISDKNNTPIPNSSNKFINNTFTQAAAFEEFVRASEGVPRDAINIISIAAQKANDKQISAPIIRSAALSWYTRAKFHAVSAKENAQELLNWIVDDVIKHRQAKAFLIPADVKDELLDSLYDARVIHLLKQGISAQDIPGKRFNVFALDYGCYVDLINTSRAPKGLFEADTADGLAYVEVPYTDFRSIRRAILDIDKFYKSTKSFPEHPN